MIFDAFKDIHIEQASALVFDMYKRERNEVPSLPEFQSSEFICKLLTDMSGNGLGVVAEEGGKVVGFLTCYNPIEKYFGNSSGVFSPIHAHGTIHDGSSRIYSFLYQEAAKIWVKQGLLSHVIALFAHDAPAVQSFFHNGFGLRCVDAIRPLEKIPAETVKGYSYCECASEDYSIIAQMENKIIYHLRSSPMFMPRNPNKGEASVSDSVSKEKSRFFIVKYKSDPVGFLKINDEGENFACEVPDMKNVCGAYLEPSHRLKSVFTGLLSYVSDILTDEGYRRLGVDYESFNPTANAFWNKHFTPYTYSLARRIDERIYSGNK